MTIAVDMGRKATKQTNKHLPSFGAFFIHFFLTYFRSTSNVANSFDPDQA